MANIEHTSLEKSQYSTPLEKCQFNSKNTCSVLPVVVDPDPILLLKSEKVSNVDDETRQFMDDMLATMYANNGVGLAAVQVGALKKIIVIDVDQIHINYCTNTRSANPYCKTSSIQHSGKPLFMVNAEIIEKSEKLSLFKEGCLSFPGIEVEVARPSNIVVQYLDYNGKEQELKVNGGILAVCIQHEIDHTNGIVFTDYS